MKPEDLKGELKPRTETYIRLNPKVKKATEEEVTTCIGRAKKQLALFKEIKCFVDNLHETVTTEGIRKRPYPKKPVRDEKPNEQQKRDGITKKRVMEFNNYSPSVLNGLIAKGILETYEVEVAKKEKDLPFQELTPLNEPQLHALEAIKRCLKERPTCLLHGVAGSGKTKLYMHLAKEYIERGQQVLYLMPEIALTTRLTKRLKAAFGNKMALYHSEMSERERVEVWNKMQSDEPYQLILGGALLALPAIQTARANRGGRGA